MAQGAAALPLASKQFPASPTLEQPGPKRRKKGQRKEPTFGEPEVPDIEAEVAANNLEPDSKDIVEEKQFEKVTEIDEDSLLQPDWVAASKLRRKTHTRRWKSRPKASTEVQDEMLRTWLAKKQLDAPLFNRFHNRMARLQGAGSCQSGGWKSWRGLLRSGETINCPRCLLFMSENDITQEAAANIIKECDEQPSDAEARNSEAQVANTDPPPPDPESSDPDDETRARDKCIKLIGSYAPEIELIENSDGILRYRCLICASRRQKNGKVNKLGPPRYKNVKKYLKQHVTCPSHQKKMLALKSPKKEEDARVEEVNSECKGLTLPSSPAAAYIADYLDEIKLWFTYLVCKSVRHQYNNDISSGEILVKHADCPGEYVKRNDTDDCCPKCAFLGSPKGIIRSVIRFIHKYYAALLLQKRLFGTELEVKTTIQSLKSTTFGKRNEILLKQVLDLTNADLQVWVCKRFRSVPLSERNKAFEFMMSTLVEPLARVHTSAIGSNVAALCSEFVQALEEQKWDAPWLCSAYRIACLIFPNSFDALLHMFLLTWLLGAAVGYKFWSFKY